jgi:hypothetical protein
MKGKPLAIDLTAISAFDAKIRTDDQGVFLHHSGVFSARWKPPHSILPPPPLILKL